MANWKHGGAIRGQLAPEYRSWSNMRTRCHNTNDEHYTAYGGRGITICPEWEDFAVFLSDMGNRPSPSHSIERLDVNAGYFKRNCCWATAKDQVRNQRRTKLSTALAAEIRRRFVGGNRVQLAAEYGVSRSTISKIADGRRWA